jgi:hypothetical protein
MGHVEDAGGRGPRQTRELRDEAAAYRDFAERLPPGTLRDAYTVLAGEVDERADALDTGQCAALAAGGAR